MFYFYSFILQVKIKCNLRCNESRREISLQKKPTPNESFNKCSATLVIKARQVFNSIICSAIQSIQAQIIPVDFPTFGRHSSLK